MSSFWFCRCHRRRCCRCKSQEFAREQSSICGFRLKQNNDEVYHMHIFGFKCGSTISDLRTSSWKKPPQQKHQIRKTFIINAIFIQWTRSAFYMATNRAGIRTTFALTNIENRQTPMLIVYLRCWNEQLGVKACITWKVIRSDSRAFFVVHDTHVSP